MKSFKPKWWEKLYWYILMDTNDLLIDMKHLEFCCPYRCFYKEYGKTVFVFDIDSCEFFEEEKK